MLTEEKYSNQPPLQRPPHYQTKFGDENTPASRHKYFLLQN